MKLLRAVEDPIIFLQFVSGLSQFKVLFRWLDQTSGPAGCCRGTACPSPEARLWSDLAYFCEGKTQITKGKKDLNN